MMGLRLREGIPVSSLQTERGNDGIQKLFDNGFLEISNDRIRVPMQHWTILDSILAKILLAIGS